MAELETTSDKTVVEILEEWKALGVDSCAWCSGGGYGVADLGRYWMACPKCCAAHPIQVVRRKILRGGVDEGM